MDDEAYEILSQLSMPNVYLIRLADFEDSELLKIKSTRTQTEYCWTVTPSLPLYILKKYPELDMVSYVDADCFFFSSPEPIFQEMEDKSVLIIEHKYSPQYESLEKTSGRFNVGVLAFKQNVEAYQVLEDWRAKCNEWCYYRYEDGKLGDQLYLNQWPTEFPQVHILQHIGGCVAPWNIHQYEVSLIDDASVTVNDRRLIFYHFHAFKILCDLSYIGAVNYQFDPIVYNLIYEPYIKEIRKARLATKKLFPSFEKGIETVEQSLKLKAAYGNRRNIPQKFVDKFFRGVRKVTLFLWKKKVVNSNGEKSRQCPICLSNKAIPYLKVHDDRYGYPGSFQTFHCTNCQHRFLDACFSNAELSHLYSEYYPRKSIQVKDVQPVQSLNGCRDWWDGNERAVHTVPEYVRVLDIGCGLGESLLYHRARGCEAYGSEADEKAKEAVQYFGLPIQVGAFQAQDYKPGFFDYVTMDQVIEHIQDPKVTLKEISGLLKLGGKFSFSTPHGNGLGATIFGKKWIHWHAPYHLHYFSKQSLQELFKDSDFEIAEIRQVTCAEWMYYQIRSAIDFPEEGKPSGFWASHRPFAKINESPLRTPLIAIAAMMRKYKINQILTRLFDSIGLGDNWIVVVIKTR